MRMKSKSTYRFAAILALLTFWIAISCTTTPEVVKLGEESVQQWNETVDKTIDDPDRAMQLKILGLQLINTSKSLKQDIEAFNRQVVELNANYAATRQDLQALVDAYIEKRNAKVKEYSDTIFIMRSEVSESEWHALID
jgi:hypothetical protein